MNLTKEMLTKGSKCVLLTKNAYGKPVVYEDAKIDVLGSKYLTAKKGKTPLRFDYERQVYNGLMCIDEGYRFTVFFRNKEEMKEHIVRERYMAELKKLFNNPQLVTLSVKELKKIYEILVKEKDDGTK